MPPTKLANGMTEKSVKQICNHKTHGLRCLFGTGTKQWSENLFLWFKHELNVRLVCNQHLLSWKHTACLETLVCSKWLRIHGNFNVYVPAWAPRTTRASSVTDLFKNNRFENVIIEYVFNNYHKVSYPQTGKSVVALLPCSIHFQCDEIKYV